MLDALLFVYQGKALNSTLLGPLDVSQFQFIDNQLGGVGAGTFTVKAAWESAEVGNLQPTNMVKAYMRLDHNTAAIASGATVITVANPSRFTVGKEIAIYDGVHNDVASVTAVGSSTITIGTATANSYGIGATLMQLRYRGMISAVTQDISLDPTTKIETISYFSQLGNYVEDSFSGGGKECGWVLYQLLNKHASEMNVVLDTANFVMSSDGTTTAASSGTGVPYMSQSTNQKTGSIISDLIKTANTNTAGTVYTIWVDEFANVHFGPVATSPSVTIDLVSYQNNVGAGNADGLYDSIGALTRRTDSTNLANVVKVTGGSSSSGSGTLSIEVTNSNSISTYGQVEGTLSNPYISDPQDLANWAEWQVENMAYPQETYNMSLHCAGSFVTSRDFVKITGFTDSSSVEFSPFAVTTKWDAKTFGQFQQDIQGGDVHPDVTRIMKEIARQHYVATQNALDATSNLKDRFVQWGLGLTTTSNSASAVLAQGALGANVVVSGSEQMQEFDTSQQTFYPSSDGAYSIAYLYRNTDGTKYSSPKVIMYSGYSAVNYSGAKITDYQVIPLWTFTRLGGQILTPMDDRRNIAGVTGTHLIPNPTPNTIPAITNSPSLVYTNVGEAAYDVKFDMNLNVGTAPWLKCIAFYVLPHNVSPTTNSHVYARIPVNANGTYSSVALNALTSGVSWDIWVAFEDQQSKLSAPAYIATTATNPMNVNPGQLPGVADTTVTINDVTLGNYQTGRSRIDPLFVGTPTTMSVDVTLTPVYTASSLDIKYFEIHAVPDNISTTSKLLYSTSHGFGVGRLTNDVLPSSGQPCTITVAGMPMNTACNLYFYAIGWDGSYIYPSTNPIADTPAQPLSLTTKNLPGMPSGTQPQNLSSKNLYPDSEFRTFATNNYGWFNTGAALQLSESTGPNGSNQLVTASGTANGDEGIKVNVQSGKTYCFAIDVDATEVTSGSQPAVEIRSSDDSTILSSVNQANGTNSRIYCTYAVPAGTSQVSLHIYGAGGTVTAGGSVKFSQPQFEIGSSPTDYVPSLAQAYPNVGAATFDAQAYVMLDATSSLNWLDAVELMAQPSNGLSDWSLYNTLTASASGLYDCTWGALGAGVSYNLGVRYKDHQGAFTSVLQIGSTPANPLQSNAIAAGAVGISQTTGIFDGGGKLVYSVNSPPMTSTIGASAQAGTAGNTYLNNSAVSTNQVQAISIVNTQLVQYRYDTALANKRNGSSYQWYSENLGAYLGLDAVLQANDTITYDTGTGLDSTSGAAQSDTYSLPANGQATLKFKHSPFLTGGNGDITITFTASSVGQAPPVANSPSVSGSDQPSITHTTTNNYTNDLEQYPFTSQTSTATITQQQNAQTYTMNQHNSGDKSSGTMQATITTSTSYSTTTTATDNISIGMGVQSYSDTFSANEGCEMQVWNYTRSANSLIPSTSFTTGSNAMCDGSHGLELSYNLPSSISFETGHYGSNETSTYNTTTHTYIYKCSLTSDTRSYPSFAIGWNVTLKDPSGNVVQTWTNVTGNSTLTSTAGTGAVGTYTWVLQPQYTTDPGGTTSPDGSANVSGTASSTYYYPTTTYTGNDSGWVLVAQTPASIVAPQTAGTQVQWNSNAVTNASNSQGAAQVHVVITRNSDGAWVKDCGYISPNTVYAYYSGSETGTQFNVYARAETTTVNNNGTATYNLSTDGTLYWYFEDPNPITYSYPTANGATITEHTDNNSNIVAPTSSSVAVGVVIQSLSATSNSYGASTLYMDILDPNGNKVVSAQPIGATGTYEYYGSSAVAGQYTFNFYAEITTNNDNATGTQNFPVTFSGYIFDYNNNNHPITTYYNNSGTVSNYSTGTNTVSPANSSTAVSLNLSSVSCQGTNTSYGTNDICIQLQDPSGTYLALQYSTDGGTTWNTAAANTSWAPNGYPVAYVSGAVQCRYYAAGAPTGVYKWTVYGMAVSNDTGDAQYTNSWSGSQTYYTPGASGGNTYVLQSNGTTQRLSTNDSDIQFQLITPGYFEFNVYNNAAQSVPFTIAVDVKGV